MFLSKFINKNYFILLTVFLINFSSSKIISNKLETNQICSSTTYDNTSVTEECISGPKKEKRILQYSTYEEYMSSRNFKHNGLPFYSSLYVDTDFHDLGDFMDGGMIIIYFFIITLIFLIAWIPMIFCWKYRCCLFDESCTESKNCFIFWNVVTYVIFAAILSFIIVCIIFAE